MEEITRETNKDGGKHLLHPSHEIFRGDSFGTQLNLSEEPVQNNDKEVKSQGIILEKSCKENQNLDCFSPEKDEAERISFHSDKNEHQVNDKTKHKPFVYNRPYFNYVNTPEFGSKEVSRGFSTPHLAFQEYGRISNPIN